MHTWEDCCYHLKCNKSPCSLEPHTYTRNHTGEVVSGGVFLTRRCERRGQGRGFVAEAEGDLKSYLVSSQAGEPP